MERKKLFALIVNQFYYMTMKILQILRFLPEICDDHKEVADHLGRKPETVRKYMYKYRRECNND